MILSFAGKVLIICLSVMISSSETERRVFAYIIKSLNMVGSMLPSMWLIGWKKCQIVKSRNLLQFSLHMPR